MTIIVGNSLSTSQGKGKVCLYTTLPKPHLCDCIEYIVVLVEINDNKMQITSKNHMSYKLILSSAC